MVRSCTLKLGSSPLFVFDILSSPYYEVITIPNKQNYVHSPVKISQIAVFSVIMETADSAEIINEFQAKSCTAFIVMRSRLAGKHCTSIDAQAVINPFHRGVQPLK